MTPEERLLHGGDLVRRETIAEAVPTYRRSAMYQVDSARHFPREVRLTKPRTAAETAALDEMTAFLRSQLPRVTIAKEPTDCGRGHTEGMGA